MKTIVITNVWGPYNRGDAALVEALVAEIRKTLRDVPHRISGMATYWELCRDNTFRMWSGKAPSFILDIMTSCGVEQSVCCVRPR